MYYRIKFYLNSKWNKKTKNMYKGCFKLFKVNEKLTLSLNNVYEFVVYIVIHLLKGYEFFSFFPVLLHHIKKIQGQPIY